MSMPEYTDELVHGLSCGTAKLHYSHLSMGEVLQSASTSAVYAGRGDKPIDSWTLNKDSTPDNADTQGTHST